MRINPAIQPNQFADDLHSEEYWFPVRKSGDDGHEFILLSEWGADAAQASHNAIRTDDTCGPSYAKTNPVIRVVRLNLIAVEG